jgi:N-methylhydantoinase B
VRILAPSTTLSVLAEKAVLPPFGVCGGEAGARNRFWILRHGEPVAPSPLPGKVGAFPIEPDDILMMESSGGGGFGDPLEREIAAVAADVAEGYVSRLAAERIYGVVWRDDGIAPAATAARRQELRAARLRVRVRPAPDLDSERGRAIRLDGETSRTLGVRPGAVVELVNPRGAPLRAWVQELTTANGHLAELDPTAIRMLPSAGHAEFEIRAVHSGTLGQDMTGSPWA